ncbi:MAG TPA: class I SAM-dependent methyltransferase [Candidatus Dormibacteraeota bacterium]|nr:class I SAM-dependent methyltransferase [Candidatus Dormibacteraeota bacterium]
MDDLDRSRALLFDGEAERYDRTRPGYPEELVDAVLGPAPQGLRVLDVACGTGIAARAMARRGAEVLGVDLSPNMAAIARRHGIPVEVARFETWDDAGRRFDRITCGQAWHWLDRTASAARCAGLLDGDGRLCIFWSSGQHPDDLHEALVEVYARTLPADVLANTSYGAARGDDLAANHALVAAELRGAGFTAVDVAEFTWTRRYTRDLWLDQVRSHSDHIALPPDLRERLLAEVGATIDGHGGGFEMPHAATLLTATRGG